MDETTRTVREFYEAYSYPSGPPVMRVGFDVRLLASYGARARPIGRPWSVLDAGCGRGRGLIGAASLQPDVQFVGVDVNRVGLAEVEEEARRRGLDNVRVQAMDLMCLDELDVPDGGFDVIHCSGVIHHLTDPAVGLANLGRVLAPHGVLELMVYSKRGRENIHPIARAIDHLCAPEEGTAERLRVGRELARVIAARGGDDEMWSRACTLDDVEFVDRYLPPRETSYDVEDLWKLIEAAELEFLRWVHSASWDVHTDLPPGPLRDRADRLAPRDQFRLMQELRHGGRLQLYLGRQGNRPRPALETTALASTTFAVHPEGTFVLTTRNLRQGTRIEELKWRGPGDEEFLLPRGPLAIAAQILRGQTEPFRGAALLDALSQEGLDPEVCRGALHELAHRDVLYRPHPEVPAALPTAAVDVVCVG